MRATPGSTFVKRFVLKDWSGTCRDSHDSCPLPIEGWVLDALRVHGEEGRLFEDLYYWAPHSGGRTEVDFLLRRGNEFVAIEVKSQPRYYTGMLPGLRAIGALAGNVRRVLVYSGKRSFRTPDGIDVWTFDRLHQTLAGNTLWP